MSKITLRYVHAFTDRHGHTRHYFRRGRVRAALPGDPGSVEYMDAYGAALAEAKADAPEKPDPRGAPKAGTFNALRIAYYNRAGFKTLSASSQINYRRVIDGFCEKHGHRRVAQMRYAHMTKIMADMADRPGAAIVLLKRIRGMVAFAVKLDWIPSNTLAGVETYKSTEFHTWTEAEIAQYEARWPLGTPERLAFDTMLYTGQRVSDASRMPVPDRAGKMRFTQKKTDHEMTLTAHRRLVESIAASGVRGMVINLTAYGQPRTAKGFSNFVSAAITAAGLPDRCVPHGLRKAAARRLAEIGCSPHEIMALTGHQTLAEVERYTRAVEQEGLNARATAKQEAVT